MDLPVVDLSRYLEISARRGAGALPPAAAEVEAEEVELRALCATVSGCLRDTGALLVKDPRCSVEDNDRFLDMMERYFGRPEEFKRLQARPALHYQIEWLTGGKCLAGMHEVTVTNRTLEAIEFAKQQNRSIWRVSSTVSVLNAILKPLGHFAETPFESKYPPTCAGDFVERELGVINLKGRKGYS
ncbi:hypothetical protein BHM03_00017228 [Ensete ventricosum]|nr:hypothetical protein BHM03_00017228 [Ensete ventricosum]